MFLDQKLSQKEIHEENVNLLKYFFDSDNKESDDYTKIKNYVVSHYKDDKESLQEYFNKLEDIKKFATLSENSTINRPGVGEHGSNSQHTVLAEAIIAFSATVMSQVIQGDKVVSPYMQGKDDERKALEDDEIEEIEELQKIDGFDMKDDSKHKKATRAIDFINYLLLKKSNKWASDLDKLGVSLAAFGNAYKKISYNASLEQIENNLILPQKLIFNYDTSEFEQCVKTEEQEIYNREYIKHVMSDYFIDFSTKQDILDRNDEALNLNTKQEIFEQHTYLDLDQDGCYEPYIIYFNSAKLLRISPRYTEDDIAQDKEGNIINITAKKIYQPFYFLPSLNNSVFAQSFGTLLYQPINVLNTCKNQLLDAGKLSNAASTTALLGVDSLGNAGRKHQTNFKFQLGEIKTISMSGQDLAKQFVRMPFGEPSQTLYNLMQDTLIEAKSLVSLRDVLTGDIGNNVASVTALARIDQGLKQYKSIYKRIHQSLQEEFKMIFDIIYDNFDVYKKEYLKYHDLEESEEYTPKDDFNNTGFDITPVSTADIVMSSQKIAEIGLLKELAASPEVDQRKVLEKICKLHGFDVDSLLIEEKNELDPISELEMQSKVMDNGQKQADIDKTYLEIEEIKSNITKNSFEMSIKHSTEAIKVKDDELKRDSDKEKNSIDNRKVDLDEKKFESQN